MPAWLSGGTTLSWIGVVLALAGFVLIAVGWGQVAGETEVYLQLPYLVSAGLTGLGLIMVGVTLINLSAKQRDARRARPTDRQVGQHHGGGAFGTRGAAGAGATTPQAGERPRMTPRFRPGAFEVSVVVTLAVAGAGFIGLWTAWSGLAAEIFVPFQVPYLVSGALGGLALAGFALGVLAIQSTRRAEATRRAEFERVVDAAVELLETVRSDARA